MLCSRPLAAPMALLKPTGSLIGNPISSITGISYLPYRLALDSGQQNGPIIEWISPAAPLNQTPVTSKTKAQQDKTHEESTPAANVKEKVIFTISGGCRQLLQSKRYLLIFLHGFCLIVFPFLCLP